MFLKSFLTLFIAYSTFAQTFNFNTLGALPSVLDEASGIIQVGLDSFLLHNDGGDTNHLYLINKDRALLKTYVVKNVRNKDWEAITLDAQKNIYIGEFGNNNNRSTNLKIFKLPPLHTIVGDSILPDSIQFTYVNQTQIPVDTSQANFDAEAMVVMNGKIHIFTKNRTLPFTGYTYCHQLSTTPGVQVTTLVDSLLLDNIVTDATYKDGKLALLSYENTNFFNGSNKIYFFNPTINSIFNNLSTYTFTDNPTQKEGITFGSDTLHLYIADEKVVFFGGNLYELSQQPVTSISENTEFNLKLVLHSNQLKLVGVPAHGILSLFSLDGRLIHQQEGNSEVLNCDISALKGLVVATFKTKTATLYQKIHLN